MPCGTPLFVCLLCVLQAFKLFDAENKQTISIDNLKAVAADIGENMTDEELMEMMEYCTKQRSKDKKEKLDPRAITEEEFMRLMKKCNLY